MSGFKIGTINLQYENKLRNKDKSAFVAAVCKLIIDEELDIVAIQEISHFKWVDNDTIVSTDRYGIDEYILAMLKKHASWGSVMRDPKRVDCAILANYDKISKFAEDIRVVCVHLDDRGFYYPEKHHKADVAEILTKKTTCKYEVVLGDFNTESKSDNKEMKWSAIDEFEKAGFTDLWKGTGQSTWWNKNGKGFRIDYILTRGGLEVTSKKLINRVPELSDHAFLIAELKFGGVGTPYNPKAIQK